MLRTVVVAALMAVPAVAISGGAAAHTEPDYVAVPAGFEAAVNLKPTHGCGDSPTVSVRIRSPLPAAAGEVEGWTATSTPQQNGRTVLEWSGGVLPADTEGAFPIAFVVPDAPGDLLVFPAVQRCENGEELAWLSGDPADEFPAPRVLILPAGLEPALTIDDVPPDVPGREKLTAVVDVDQPNTPPTVPPTTAAPTTAAPTTTPPTTTPPTTAAPTTTGAAATTGTASTTAPATTTVTTTVPSPATSLPSATTADDGDDSGGTTAAVVIIAAVVAAAGAATALVVRARRRAGGSE